MVESSFGAGGWLLGRKAGCQVEGEREVGSCEGKLELVFFFTSSFCNAGISWHSISHVSGPGLGEAKENDPAGDWGVVRLGGQVSLTKGTCTRAAMVIRALC